mgnify:FL=1|jgi:hypothetical protein
MKNDEKEELSSAEVNIYVTNDCGKPKVGCEEDCLLGGCWISCEE